MWSPTTISFWQWTGRRTQYSRGMNFDKLSKAFAELGCQSAYNLDGGSSVTLYDNGEIVNQPCWWFADEREISDIVYVEKPQSDAQDDTQTEVQDETQSDAQTE